jgi:hypothetical protein
MKKRAMALGLLILLAAVCVPASSAAEALITIQPDTTRMYVNDEFILYVTANSEIDSLMGYDVTLRFDPWHLEVMSVSEGSLPLSSGYATFFMWLNEDSPGERVDSGQHCSRAGGVVQSHFSGSESRHHYRGGRQKRPQKRPEPETDPPPAAGNGYAFPNHRS